MIVRIATEGQYEVGDDDVAALNALDNAAVAACEETDGRHFTEAFRELLGFVRTQGTRLEDEALIGSDIILPPPDVTLAEARTEFQGEGLIPG